MKTKGITMAGAVVLSALFGMSAIGYAGQERQGDKQDHAKPQQGSHEQERPAQQPHGQPQQAHPQQGQDRPRQGQAQQQGQQPRGQQAQPQRQNQPQQDRGQQQQVQRQYQPQQDRGQHQRQYQQQDRGQQQQVQRQYQPQQDRGQQRQIQDRQQLNSQQTRVNGRPQRSPEQRNIEQSAWQQHRAGNWQSDHRNWQQRGGYSGYRIPDDRYRGYFGREHGFRIGGLPFMVVGGYPRFQYGGYWFSMIDPYPGYWSDDWYDTDDVYVDYVDDGYYMYNRRYPGVGIAISISM